MSLNCDDLEYLFTRERVAVKNQNPYLPYFVTAVYLFGMTLYWGWYFMEEAMINEGYMRRDQENMLTLKCITNKIKSAILRTCGTVYSCMPFEITPTTCKIRHLLHLAEHAWFMKTPLLVLHAILVELLLGALLFIPLFAILYFKRVYLYV
jgi:hypothetical protein